MNPLFIAHRKNLPLWGNSVSVLFTSSEWLAFFIRFWNSHQSFNKTFWHSHTYNLKHLPMRKSWLLVTTYYLQILLHDINLKLTLGTLFAKGNWSIIWSTWPRDSENVFWCVDWTLPFYQFYYVQISTSSRHFKWEVPHQNVIPGKFIWPHSWHHL